MKILILVLITLLPFISHSQSRYEKWRSDSTRKHDSTFWKRDTSLIRLKIEFRKAKANMESSKSKEDSSKFNDILSELLFKQRERDEKNHDYGQKNTFKN